MKYFLALSAPILLAIDMSANAATVSYVSAFDTDADSSITLQGFNGALGSLSSATFLIDTSYTLANSVDAFDASGTVTSTEQCAPLVGCFDIYTYTNDVYAASLGRSTLEVTTDEYPAFYALFDAFSNVECSDSVEFTSIVANLAPIAQCEESETHTGDWGFGMIVDAADFDFASVSALTMTLNESTEIENLCDGDALCATDVSATWTGTIRLRYTYDASTAIITDPVPASEPHIAALLLLGGLLTFGGARRSHAR